MLGAAEFFVAATGWSWWPFLLGFEKQSSIAEYAGNCSAEYTKFVQIGDGLAIGELPVVFLLVNLWVVALLFSLWRLFC